MSLKTIWIDFCENGSVHGLRHVIQKDGRSWERYQLNKYLVFIVGNKL